MRSVHPPRSAARSIRSEEVAWDGDPRAIFALI